MGALIVTNANQSTYITLHAVHGLEYEHHTLKSHAESLIHVVHSTFTLWKPTPEIVETCIVRLTKWDSCFREKSGYGMTCTTPGALL